MSLYAIIQQLFSGMVISIEIFALTLVLSMPLGLIIALGRISKNTIVRNVTKLYISIMRGTPLILQLMVVYFGPYYLFGMKVSLSYRFIAVIIGFVINYAAYFGEVYRGGIEAIPKGQYEASDVLGYSKYQTFMKIVLPQVFKIVLPSITNEIITLVKDTSLAHIIAVSEMFTEASKIAAAQTTMIPFIVAGLFYYIFNFVAANIMERIEKKFSYYR